MLASLLAFALLATPAAPAELVEQAQMFREGVDGLWLSRPLAERVLTRSRLLDAATARLAVLEELAAGRAVEISLSAERLALADRLSADRLAQLAEAVKARDSATARADAWWRSPATRWTWPCVPSTSPRAPP